jgi:primosomal protein N'
MKKRAVFKFNNGYPVLLCSKCSVIIKYHKYFTEDEKLACKGELKLKPQYCDECSEKLNLFEPDI